MKIRKVKPSDAPSIVEIYNYYIINTLTTFEIKVIDAVEMEKRINAYSPKFPWLVCELEGKIVAYAYACPWKMRKAYLYSVESSVYVDHKFVSRGIGIRLYQQLLDELKQININAVIAGITLPNISSIAMHEKLGFEKIGQFKQVGRKFDKWIDVGYWELMLP